MPYSVEQRGSNYVVRNTHTGKVKGTHRSKEKAESQVRLLRGIEHGMMPRGRK